MAQFTPTHELADGSSIGPKMHRCAAYVSQNGPVPSRNVVAKAVGPNGSQRYGYEIVKRARRAGLITIDPDHTGATPSGGGAVLLTAKGQRYLDEYDVPSHS